MSKVYKCDGCEVMIEKPHDVKMKEFYIATEYDLGMAFPINSTRKVKIHLCFLKVCITTYLHIHRDRFHNTV
jgi:hypothetical protein